MNQSSVEKNGWLSHRATSGRPVAARATFTAAVVASDPFLANFTISAPGTWARNVSAARSSQMLGRLKLIPSAAADAAAVDDRPIAVAEGDRAQTHAVLDILVAVQILDPGAAPADDDRTHVLRILVRPAGVGVGTTGDDGVQPGLRGIRPRERSTARSPADSRTGIHRGGHR